METSIPKKLDILIPTFNRVKDPEKNITTLVNTIEENSLKDRVNILLSDNSSGDNTSKVIERFSKQYPYVFGFIQSNNIGLEKNAVFCLEKSTSEFIMYLGDDDFLHSEYLNRVVKVFRK